MVVVVVVVVYSEFSVLLWSKALVLDLDQAEQLIIVKTPTQPQLNLT